jgi:hyaluronan synthase
VGLAVGLIASFHHGDWTLAALRPSSAFYVAVAAMFLWTLWTAMHPRTYAHLPVASGRVVVIVPTYNEDPAMLHWCLQSLVTQTREPDAIVVVDDGSAKPIRRFAHPLITYRRQTNQGKRAAQINGLRGYEDYDFVVTVDSDSILECSAIEHLLRVMSDPSVAAVTGNMLVANWRANLLTRLVDLEIVAGNLMSRSMRTRAGAVAPTSGPLALYRGGVVFDNTQDYLTSGTFSDDRRLTHYALGRGRVVVCEEAFTYMHMPETLRTTWRQRLRWFKGQMLYFGWEIRNLNGAALYLRVWGTVLMALLPIMVVWMMIVLPAAYGIVFLKGWVYWLGLLWLGNLPYVLRRPSMPLSTRLAHWLLLTPLLIPFQWLLIRPVMYLAVIKRRESGWLTRDANSTPAATTGSRMRNAA